jgi:hypothetical protein
MVEGVGHPASLGLLDGFEVLETKACPWPRVSTPLPAVADLAKVDPNPARLVWDIVDEWGDQSFPASDPPANW